MTKGTKAFRIIISVILALTILWTAFISFAVIVYIKYGIVTDEYGITVAGVSVTTENRRDVLGDGTVYYSPSSNTLTFDNAVIEYDSSIIHTITDLKVNLVGENKFICKDNSYIIAIYASDYLLTRDIYFEGTGSLSIEYQNMSDSAVAIFGNNVTIGAKIDITTPDVPGTLGGIVSFGTLTIKSTADVTVNAGASGDSAAVGVRGNVIFEPGAKMTLIAKPGTTGPCRGIAVEGDLILGKDSSLNVTLNNDVAGYSECVSVSGVLDIAAGASLTASAEKGHAVEVYSSIKANKDATITAETAGEGADILCYGALVNYGATVDAEVEALGGIYNKIHD